MFSCDEFPQFLHPIQMWEKWKVGPDAPSCEEPTSRVPRKSWKWPTTACSWPIPIAEKNYVSKSLIFKNFSMLTDTDSSRKAKERNKRKLLFHNAKTRVQQWLCQRPSLTRSKLWNNEVKAMEWGGQRPSMTKQKNTPCLSTRKAGRFIISSVRIHHLKMADRQHFRQQPRVER